ncbi:hypothetical protein DERF_004171 [Dermatophagoides farinae]|uniref:Uncharacterized protein n=1 Tax=Dermatophagoides farinae TaxID=6954 RepID=A0A922I0W7_DERFA|nr:hypothetical protein DERF_004171 [Dermatophagoides farinae]
MPQSFKEKKIQILKLISISSEIQQQQQKVLCQHYCIEVKNLRIAQNDIISSSSSLSPIIITLLYLPIAKLATKKKPTTIIRIHQSEYSFWILIRQNYMKINQNIFSDLILKKRSCYKC